MRIFILSGIVAAGLSVILGAFGAHALKAKIEPEQLLVFETGVRYQMYHALALLLVYLIGQKTNSVSLQYSGWFFIAGIIFFSGSLYLLACKDLIGLDSWKKILGPVTPIGGLLLIIGWISLFISALKINVNN